MTLFVFLFSQKTNTSCALRVKQRLTGGEKNKKVKGHQCRTLTLLRAYMVGVGYPVTDMCHLGFMCICMWVCVCVNYRGQSDFMNVWSGKLTCTVPGDLETSFNQMRLLFVTVNEQKMVFKFGLDSCHYLDNSTPYMNLHNKCLFVDDNFSKLLQINLK